MNICITGGAGFFGSHIADAFLDAGHFVTVIDTLATGRKSNIPAKARFRHQRAGDVGTCDAWDWIIHAAAVVGVEHVEAHPEATLADAWVAGEMAVIAKSLGCRLCFISSSEVYDLQPDASPRWNYAVSKRFAEAWIQAKLPTALIVRPFNLVGPRQRPDFGMVLPRFVKACLAGEPLPRVLPGTQRRSFLHVQDAAQGILTLVEHGSEGVFDLGGMSEFSITELGRMVGAILEKPITFKDLPERAHDVPERRLPDTTKLEALGWRQTKGLPEAIKDLAEELA